MITITQKLISPNEMKAQLSVSDQLSDIRLKKIEQICAILSGKDDRLLVIIGPCSADNEQAFYQYLSLLSDLDKKLNDRILLVPRLYTAKPRSRGDSYKGIIYSNSPLEAKVDLKSGLMTARRMFISALQSFGFVCADEILHTDTYEYFDDIAAYGVIGARNAESQQHRFLASGLDIPVAIKNPMSGNIDALVNAIYTAQKPSSFISDGCQVQSTGNPFAHAVLRGGVDRQGNHFSNYGVDQLSKLSSALSTLGISNPAIIVDVNHSNSGKNYLNQSKILMESFASACEHKEYKSILKGYMIESYLMDGSCERGELAYGKSVTDGCLGWHKTEALLYWLWEAHRAHFKG